VRQGKGRKDRTTYLGARARKHMLRYYLDCGAPSPHGPVWRNERTGERLTTSGLRRLLLRLGEATSVPHCAPHTFRRTFALWSLRSGMSIYHLQRLMGHEDITVLRQYLALVDDDIAGAHARYGAVDNMLGARPPRRK
jgi:site-specific recombinase XerD